MAELRQVTLGANYTDISATIPLHYLKIWADGDRNATALEYKTPDDDFTANFITDASMGDFIERIGPGRHGLLGVPTGFSKSSQVATVLLKIRFVGGGAAVINILESENAL